MLNGLVLNKVWSQSNIRAIKLYSTMLDDVLLVCRARPYRSASAILSLPCGIP